MYKSKEDLTLGDLRRPKKHPPKYPQLDLHLLHPGDHVINRSDKRTVEVVESSVSPSGRVSVEVWEYNRTIHLITMSEVDQWRLPRNKSPHKQWFDIVNEEKE